MKYLLALLLIGNVWAGDLPPVPGAVNPDITQANIKETICNRGHWSTKSIRPPVSYTNKLKLQQMKQWKLKGVPHDFEEDHLIPLTVGGNPTSPLNLWPEPWNGEWGAHKKDRLEVKLNKLVCTGTISLQDAQNCISSNWIECYRKWIR